MPRRKRNPDERPQGMEGSQNFMTRALASFGMADVAKYLLVRQVFDQAVGPLVASNAQPISLSRGQLVIAAHSSTWQTELHFLRERIAESINAALPAPWIEKVRLVSRSARAAEKHTMPAPKPTADDPSFAVQCEADMAAQPIKDNEVREAFAKMMARGLTRKADTMPSSEQSEKAHGP